MAYFLRWSLEQKRLSLSLRRGPIFLRQYKQAVGLELTMTQCSNGTLTMKCTKARIQVSWEFVLKRSKEKAREGAASHEKE